MIDLKTVKASLEQLEEERGLPREKIIGAIEDALTAAYKKDYGKKGQLIRAKFDLPTGKIEFQQVKIVVDESMLRPENEEGPAEPADARIKFNEEQHIMLEDAKKIKQDVQVDEELVFPLETREEYGRIAAQTAKQVIIQRLREAEKQSVLDEYADRAGQIVSGKVQKIERGNVLVDLGRVTGSLAREEQIPGEYYRPGERIKCFLAAVKDTPRGVNLHLSRTHPKFVEKLFEAEVPELAHGQVEIKSIAREAGGRTKLAAASHDEKIDPVGACVGQRGVRVNTVLAELGGEKIDIIEWSPDPATFIAHALAPAKIKTVTLQPETNTSLVGVESEQFSLAVGRGGQNVRLAAKLTGWKIDIHSPGQEEISPDGSEDVVKSDQ